MMQTPSNPHKQTGQLYRTCCKEERCVSSEYPQVADHTFANSATLDPHRVQGPL